MRLTSSAFDEGETLAALHTCDGQNLSPPLAWSGAPAGTKSFVLLCDDPDAPNGTWRHWAVFDIPKGRHALPEGVPPSAGDFKQAINDFRNPGYGGPCPPRGHGAHRYFFRLLALSVAALPVREQATCQDVEKEAQKHAIAEARLCAKYGR